VALEVWTSVSCRQMEVVEWNYGILSWANLVKTSIIRVGCLRIHLILWLYRGRLLPWSYSRTVERSSFATTSSLGDSRVQSTNDDIRNITKQVPVQTLKGPIVRSYHWTKFRCHGSFPRPLPLRAIQEVTQRIRFWAFARLSAPARTWLRENEASTIGSR